MARRRTLPRRSYKPKAEALGMTHPIGAAIAIARIRSTLRTLQLHLHLIEDGADAREVLPDTAWLLGIGCEVALAHQQPDLRVLHGALRSVLQMAVQGQRWNAALALAVDHALQRSQELFEQHLHTACSVQEGARWLADRIQRGTVQMTDVAGAELYSGATSPGPASSARASSSPSPTQEPA
jgi:hypothetical protein